MLALVLFKKKGAKGPACSTRDWVFLGREGLGVAHAAYKESLMG